MKLFIDETNYFDTSEGFDLSIQLSNTMDNPRAWYVDPPKFEPVRTEHYVGSVLEGGNVNFRDIFFNPHGHCTHTECLGHITQEVYSVNDVLKEFFFKATLITVAPIERLNPTDNLVDKVITKDLLEGVERGVDALIIRTTPNSSNKKKMNYSNTNPPYLDVNCVKFLIEAGIKHLLVDLPSVDRENDEGVLAFHHAFWEVPSNPDFHRTITELVYVDNDIEDGTYVLELQMASFKNDASPSRPILYKIKRG